MSNIDTSAALKARIIAAIAANGPMTLADFMAAALYDPVAGYYTIREPFGARGDFTTAPEISQIFGELVGLWILQSWLDQGSPAAFTLAEIGPGRGTLMRDALRAARVRPGFLEAAQVTLVETSPRLRSVQAETLAAFPVRWCAHPDEIERGAPIFVIANELFDALPIRQFERSSDGWRECRVGASDGQLVPGRDAAASMHPPDTRFASAPAGFIAEICPAATALMAGLAARIAADGGAALVIDYGYTDPPGRSTFQAVARHSFVDPFDRPGEADLTAHVDFGALAAAAAREGMAVHGPAPQGAFLERLGGAARAAALAKAHPEGAQAIATAWHRLAAPDAMGTLFKVLAITPPGTRAPSGFG